MQKLDAGEENYTPQQILQNLLGKQKTLTPLFSKSPSLFFLQSNAQEMGLSERPGCDLHMRY